MKLEATRAMRTALQNGDTTEAINLFDGFDGELRRVSEQESAVLDAAREIIAKVPDNRPAHAAAKQYVESLFVARQSRTEAKNDFLLHLEGGPSGPSVAEKVDAVLSARKTTKEREDALRDAGSVPVSDILQLSGPKRIMMPKGIEASQDYTLLNVGFGTASDVSVTVSGYDLTVQPTSIDALESNQSTTLTVSTPAATEVSTTFTLSANSVSNKFRIQVLSKSDYLERATDLIATLEDRLDSVETKDSKGKNGSGSGEQKSPKYVKGLRRKLESARKRIGKIERHLSKQGDKPTNNKIRDVINVLDAFINQVEGLSHRKVDERTQAILEQDATEVIDELETAIVAEK